MFDNRSSEASLDRLYKIFNIAMVSTSLVMIGVFLYKTYDERRKANENLKLKTAHLKLPATISLDSEEMQFVDQITSPDSIDTALNDIGGLELVKRGLRESVILPFSRPNLFSTSGTVDSTVSGVLLYGPPGTGKTLLARAIAKECGACFISVDSATIKSKFHGESETRVAKLFSLARKLQPCIVYFDEIDGIMSTRRESIQDIENSIKSMLLSEWDGMNKTKGNKVIVIGSTNRPDSLDAAVLRRMTRKFLVPLPDLEGRRQILTLMLSPSTSNSSNNNSTNSSSTASTTTTTTSMTTSTTATSSSTAASTPPPHQVNINQIASITDGMSGSDLRDLCKLALMIPVREFLEAESEFQAGKRKEMPPHVRELRTDDVIKCMQDFQKVKFGQFNVR